MQGWLVPPPTRSLKSRQDFDRERESKVLYLEAQGYLKSSRIKQALLSVRREEFIPEEYRDYAYLEVPLPLPGKLATISCPHSYPLFYEPLGLDLGHRFLEVGVGSGYGAALAREVVGDKGLVVSMEIDPLTYAYAKGTLARAGYHDVLLIQGDGGQGYEPLSPYDRIAITAACTEIPPPLIEQLAIGGKLISPVIEQGVQTLTLIEKEAAGVNRIRICEVLYVRLRGHYGATTA